MMDSFLATTLAALVGVVLLTVGVAGVPADAGIAMIVGGALVLAPTVALFVRREDRHG
jgi:hypothetical protein